MARPTGDKVAHELIDRFSTVIRPNRKYKTDRPDLDGKGVDTHALIGKLPRPKHGWTLPGHNYTRPYNPLDKQFDYGQETRKILKIHQNPLVCQMQWQCKTMLTTACAPTVERSMATNAW